MKRFIALFLVFSVLLLSANVFAKERNGAELYIEKKDGHHERGELIAVKSNSIILLDRYTGADVTIDIEDIGLIRVERKSLTRKGAFIGFFLGAGSGVLIAEREMAKEKKNVFTSYLSPLRFVLYGLLFGLAGIFIGAISGKLVSADSTIKLEGKSDSEIQEILEKLRKKARIKNAL